MNNRNYLLSKVRCNDIKVQLIAKKCVLPEVEAQCLYGATYIPCVWPLAIVIQCLTHEHSYN